MHRRDNSTLRAMLLFVVSILAGCTVGPAHKTPEIELTSKFTEGGPSSNGEVGSTNWWLVFDDTRLTGFVNQGLAQNLDVKQAVERINAAKADLVASKAGSLPGFEFSGNNVTTGAQSNKDVHTKQEGTVTTGGFRLTWFLDLFGLYRRAGESAAASLEEAKARADIARLALLSEAVSAYIDVRYYQERVILAQQDLASRRETLQLTQVEFNAGQATSFDTVQAKGLVDSTQGDIPELEVEFLRASHRLSTLLALSASDLLPELKKNSGQPVPHGSVSAGVPADLIRNRPDIRAAERRLASAVADIGVAEAQLYPSITLGGSIAPSYSVLPKNLDIAALSWSFGPTLNLPIFDGGRLGANVSRAESAAQEAYLAWKSTVLKSVEEVENALAAVNRDKAIIAARRAAVKTYQQSLVMARKRYQGGESSLFDVLEAQRSVSSAQTDLAVAIRKMAINYVTLNVTIGSGYAIKETDEQRPVKTREQNSASIALSE